MNKNKSYKNTKKIYQITGIRIYILNKKKVLVHFKLFITRITHAVYALLQY